MCAFKRCKFLTQNKSTLKKGGQWWRSLWVKGGRRKGKRRNRTNDVRNCVRTVFPAANNWLCVARTIWTPNSIMLIVQVVQIYVDKIMFINEIRKRTPPSSRVLKAAQKRETRNQKARSALNGTSSQRRRSMWCTSSTCHWFTVRWTRYEEKRKKGEERKKKGRKKVPRPKMDWRKAKNKLLRHA